MGKWGSCDFRQLRDLQKKMEKLQQHDYDAFCRAAAKDLAARLLAKVIRRTPVGKTINGEQGTEHMGGTLRRGWTARTEQEAESGTNKNPAQYAQSLRITKTGNVYQIEIINPVHYASYVEYGHRQQPGRFVPAIGKRLKAGWVKGRFMLTISEQELQAQAPVLLEKKLMKFLGECFDGN
jgi:hypothetical protein